MSESLSEQEEIILNVVQEYLNKNRTFNIKKILPFIQSRFRMASIYINNYGIESILKALVNKNLIVEGSKLLNQDILNNDKRKCIYEFIRQNPGTYFNRIRNKLNIANHIVVWHLEMLLKFDYINKAKIENHEVYFDSALKFYDVKINYYISNKKCRKIIDHLSINNNGVNKTNLATEVNMHINTVQKYLTILEEIGIIFQDDNTNKTLYYLNKDYVKNLII